MGYDLHITRQENYYDDNDAYKIQLDEWKELVANDPDMQLDGFADAPLKNSGTLRLESEGLAVWTKYSGDGMSGNHAWFLYDEGNIVVKNPDEEIIGKMLEIAERLNAKVQGDDDEVYKRAEDNRIVYRRAEETYLDEPRRRNRPWWKLW
jgi:hypothetical protein